MRDELAGRTLGEFVLREQIGEGGFGAVYRSDQPLLGREVVIKVLHRKLRTTGIVLQRFLREAQLASRLDHPYAAHVYAFGVEQDDGLAWIAMEMVHGIGLDRWLATRGPLSLDDFVPFFERVAEVVHTAHEQGIVHRDLKPSNIMVIERAGRLLPKLLDFGIAKLVVDEAAAAEPPDRSPEITPVVAVPVVKPRPNPLAFSNDKTITAAGPPDHDAIGPSQRDVLTDASTPLTQADAMIGSPPYMPPEQWVDALNVGPRSDLYSLGVVAYECLTGRRPFVATTIAEIVEAHCHAAVPPLGGAFPAELDPFFAHTLAKRPQDRWATALELAAQLRTAAGMASVELPRLEENPYRGLSAFDEHHRLMFFGRDRELAEMVERLRSEPWLVVAGRSGTGKSSVVRAGLVPHVRENSLDEVIREPWRVITMVPGEHPMAALAAAAASVIDRDEHELAAALAEDPASLARELRAAHRGTLLVIDQLEELVTLSNREERERFVDALVPTMIASRDLRVVATIRSDLVGHLDDVPALARGIGRAMYLLGPLDRAGLRTAITAPAAAHGVRFESDADVDTLVAGIAPHAAGLPLLEFALARLWELRDSERHVIPSRALQDIGGVEGALARHADDVIAVLSPAARTAARGLLVRLVSAERTRTRRTEDELCGTAPETRPEARAALDALVQGRLLAVGEDDRGATYELAHEALLTHWTRLRVWLDEANIDHATRARIELAAADWDRNGRSADALWRGQQIAAVATLPLDDLGAVGREFIERGRNAQRRGQRRRRGLISGAFAVLLAFLTIALWLHRRAGDARDRAEASALAAQARTAALYQEQGRQALTTGDPMRAVAYLVEAYTSGQRGVELQFLLDRASGALDGNLAVLAGHTDKVSDVTWSPDGTRVATSSIDGTIRIWTADGRAVATLRGHKSEVIQVRFSPDGTRLASASLDGTGAIWNVPAGTRQVLTGHAYKLRTIEWYPDGRRVLTGSMDKTAKVWDAESGALLATLTGTDKLAFARISPTGDRIITGGADHVAQLWDATTYQPVAKLADHGGVVWRAAFSPDGKRVVTGSDDHIARVWDAASGARIAVYTDHTRKISHVAVSPNSELVATASEDGTARIWRATTTDTIATLNHGAPVWHVAFSPDGTRVVTASSDGTAAVWSLDGTRLWTFVGHTDRVSCAVFSPDGTRLATASDDRTSRIWDARESVVRASFTGQHGTVWDARFSPSGDRIATAADDRTVWIWTTAGQKLAAWDDDRVTKRLDQYRFARWAPSGDWFVTQHGKAIERRDVRTMKVISSYPTQTPRFAIASHDGHRIAIADGSVVRVVDVEHGDPVATLDGHRAPLTTVDWSPDDRSLLTASEDNTARLWDVATSAQIATLEHGGWVVGAWFSPSGDRFLTAASDRTVTVWTAATRTAIAHFDEDTGGIDDAAWSPDGALIATASDDGAIRVWAAATGRLLTIVGRHLDEAVTVSFHPDGHTLLTSSVDGTARLWGLASTTDLATLVAHARCRVPYYIAGGLLLKRVGPCLPE